jgi:hypothetical protein
MENFLFVFVVTTVFLCIVYSIIPMSSANQFFLFAFLVLMWANKEKVCSVIFYIEDRLTEAWTYVEPFALKKKAELIQKLKEFFKD